LAGLGAERSAELARTQVRRVGKPFNRQWLVEIALRMRKRALDAVRFRLELQQRRE